MKIVSRKCIFCGAALTNSNRAKEHVLKDAWLRKLGHEKYQLNLAQFRGEDKIGERQHAANQLLSGEVCNGCNGGWMERLDHSVEKIVLTLAQEIRPIQITEQECWQLARWLVKTAYAHISCDSPDRRHITPTQVAKVKKPSFRPDGAFCMYYTVLEPQATGVVPASIDVWPSAGNDPTILTIPQTRRRKFAVQYNRIVFGFAWVRGPVKKFRLVSGIHNPLIHTGVALEMIPDDGTLIRGEYLPKEMSKDIVNCLAGYIAMIF